MKKILFLKLLVLVACLSSALSAAAYDIYYGGLYYNITSSTAKTVEVTSKPSGYYSGNITIPRTVTYNNTTYTVTALGEYAFWNHGLTSITIPNTVVSIGYGAFGWSEDAGYNTSLTKIEIPSSVTTIGGSAFYRCGGLGNVILGYGVTSIASDAFFRCDNLGYVECNAWNPPTISYDTFTETQYSNVYLYVPPYRKTVYQSATNWSNFTRFDVASYDFYYNGIYYRVTSSNTVEVANKYDNATISFNIMPGVSGVYSGSVTIPSSVTYKGTTYSVTGIGKYAFLKQTGLTGVSIPNSVTTIGDWAFNSCTGLTSVTIPNNVTTIGSNAFGLCI